jgi:uncharacterized membrane protein
MPYIPLILAVIGIVLIIAGVIIAIVDWNRKNRPKVRGMVTEGTSLDKAISALAKLAEALKDFTLGMQLVFVGTALEIIAAFIAGIGLVAK